MKKRIGISAGIILILLMLYIFIPGFFKEGSAFIGEYSVGADGTEMTIEIGAGGSAGFVRKVSAKQQGGGRLYLDCYSAFGGFNGSLGARREYTIPLESDTDTIAVYRNTNAYQEVLKKDSNGVWQRVN